MISVPLLLLVGLSGCLAYQHYQLEIPNGNSVPDPSTSGTWNGVGHLNAQGGGPRNVFGLDFAANGHTWTESLCKKDSDGDGKTNGEELGDPQCVWKKGDTQTATSASGHPGICEPLSSSTCQTQNKDVNFEAGAPFSCPATQSSDVRSTTYRFPSTVVPSRVTSYYCMYFPITNLAANKEHLIAYEPVIDNTEVMHHILVYGCKGDILTSDSPSDCSNSMFDCNELVMVWGVGFSGDCFPQEYGTLIGEGGYTGIYMEHHWNNPLSSSGLRDSSGMKIYHTANLRADEARYVIWGPMFFSLPPGKLEEKTAGECPSRTTSRFQQDHIKITKIMPHMHLLGRKMEIEHEGEVILTDNTYSYDAPKIFEYDPPREFKRGDSVKVKCTFDTTSKTEQVTYGDATDDEMCFMVAQVYPYDTSVPTFCGIPIDGAPNLKPMLALLLVAVLGSFFC